MEINKVITSLELQDKEVEDEDLNTYVITLNDSDEFIQVYATAGKVEGFDLDSENIICTESECVIPYLTDDWDITLNADYDNDVYTVTIEEAKD